MLLVITGQVNHIWDRVPLTAVHFSFLVGSDNRRFAYHNLGPISVFNPTINSIAILTPQLSLTHSGIPHVFSIYWESLSSICTHGIASKTNLLYMWLCVAQKKRWSSQVIDCDFVTCKRTQKEVPCSKNQSSYRQPHRKFGKSFHPVSVSVRYRA